MIADRPGKFFVMVSLKNCSSRKEARLKGNFPGFIVMSGRTHFKHELQTKRRKRLKERITQRGRVPSTNVMLNMTLFKLELQTKERSF